MKDRQKILDKRQKMKDKRQKTFAFAQVRNLTPFRTPDGYFEQQEQSLKAAAALRMTESRHRNGRLWIAAADCAAMLLAIYPVTRMIHIAQAEDAPVYCATDETDNWTDFANADIFMDETNW